MEIESNSCQDEKTIAAQIVRVSPSDVAELMETIDRGSRVTIFSCPRNHPQNIKAGMGQRKLVGAEEDRDHAKL